MIIHVESLQQPLNCTTYAISLPYLTVTEDMNLRCTCRKLKIFWNMISSDRTGPELRDLNGQAIYGLHSLLLTTLLKYLDLLLKLCSWKVRPWAIRSRRSCCCSADWSIAPVLTSTSSSSKAKHSVIVCFWHQLPAMHGVTTNQYCIIVIPWWHTLICPCTMVQYYLDKLLRFSLVNKA